MISYIFKDKTKNIMAIIFTAMCVASSIVGILGSLHDFYNVLLGSIATLPNIMILAYFVTLKKVYKFKEIIFPLAFAVKILYACFTIVPSILGVLKIADGWYSLILMLRVNFYNIILIAAYVFCLMGSLFNFKNVRFLKWGAVILMIWPVVFLIEEFVAVGGFAYWKSIEQEYLIGTIILHIKGVVKIIINMLFGFGIFNLTLNSKSENIDISPFNAKRKPKEYQNQFESDDLPEIPDGSWRCMACGAILPDTQDRCECGYKK